MSGIWHRGTIPGNSRVLYLDGVSVGFVDSAHLADAIVSRMNAAPGDMNIAVHPRAIAQCDLRELAGLAFDRGMRLNFEFSEKK